jgi:DNA invertase Pin-like site-specific DNA recombinase
MSKNNGSGLQLAGTGATYIRVSTDQQDTERQHAAARAFERRYGVTIPAQNWFKDEGWARDAAERRPDFQRLMKLAESGRVQWIVVDQLDRFGTKDAYQLVHYLYRLRECGCKLYDAAGKEWTGEDIATIITAVVEGEKSKGEQTSKSHRTLGGKIEKARAGEWQGGPVRLGFDVACYHRETDEELWRVIFEGRSKRLKVYPDGRTERFDGEENFPKFQPMTEVLRVAPSNDKAKVAAAVSVFKRYAAESISFTTLAHHLNKLGFRTSYGGAFQSHHVESMLEDPIFLGYYTYNRRHFGKFHRWADGRTVLELNYDERQSKNDKADWVQSRRLFEPLMELKTWDAVQKKLFGRSRRTHAPRSSALYLSGLVYCGNCGGRMVAGLTRRPKEKPRKDGRAGDRYEYRCGSYAKAIREGWRTIRKDGETVRVSRDGAECRCLRNGVFQDTLEGYVERYLEETDRRLELLTDGLDPDSHTDRLQQEASEHWEAFRDGVERLTGYLARHHPEEYQAILREFAESHAAGERDRADDGSPSRPGGKRSLAEQLGKRGRDAHERFKGQKTTPGGFVDACVACYHVNFDPAAVAAEVDRLEAEHTALVEQWADLPTPRAKEKARERFAEVETRIAGLRRQQENVSEVVEQHYRDMLDLQRAIRDAKTALQSGAGERALRRRAEALRAVVQRIECTFTATGETGGGWGKKSALMTKVTFYPVVGDSVELSADSKGTVLYSSAHSRMNRTRVGRMR